MHTPNMHIPNREELPKYKKCTQHVMPPGSGNKSELIQNSISFMIGHLVASHGGQSPGGVSIDAENLLAHVEHYMSTVY